MPRKVVRKGLSWSIGDGKDIRVWDDPWLLKSPLSAFVPTVNAEEIGQELRVADLFTTDKAWDVHKLHHGEDMAKAVMTIPIPLENSRDQFL